MDKITADDIVDLIKTYPDNRINPTNEDGSCIYSDLSGNHCIAGQVLSDLGFDVPASDSRKLVNRRLLRDLNGESIGQLLSIVGYDSRFTSDAIDLLAIAQSVADSETHSQAYEFGVEDIDLNDPHFNAWGVAKSRVLQKYELIVNHKEMV